MSLSLSLIIIISLYLTLVNVNGQFGSGTGCPEAFKGKCRCGNVTYGLGRDTFVTNCTNSNFTDTSMLRQLPIDTEVLIFTGNNVTSLPTNILGQDAKYDKLHTIDMSNNRIRYIRGKTFHNVLNVRVLNLNHNEISIEESFHPRIFSNFENLEELYLRNAFGKSKHDLDFMKDLTKTFIESDLKKVKVLNLEYNFIREFSSPVMFCFLPKLQKLHLANNLLIDFQLNLTCLNDLNLVDISDNFITTLYNNSLAYLETGPKLYHVNISRNPFRCDCNLKDFLTWLRLKDAFQLHVDSNDLYHCVTGFPIDIAGRFFDEIDIMDLSCSRFVNDDMLNYINFSYAILTSLLVTLFILLAALMYTNREYIINAWRYVSTGIAAKREYTSLEKETKRHQQQMNQEVAEVEV